MFESFSHKERLCATSDQLCGYKGKENYPLHFPRFLQALPSPSTSCQLHICIFAFHTQVWYQIFLEWDKSYGCICNILFLFFIIQQYSIFFIINLLRGFFFFSSIWVHKHLSSSLLIALAFASLLIFLSFLFFVSKFDMVSASLFKC